MTVVLSLSSSEMWLQEDNLKLVTATDDFGLTGQGTSLQPDVNPLAVELCSLLRTRKFSHTTLVGVCIHSSVTQATTCNIRKGHGGYRVGVTDITDDALARLSVPVKPWQQYQDQEPRLG